MAKQLDVGVLVICIHVGDPKFTFLIGQVGQIKQKVPPLFAMITNSDWVVDFPDTEGRVCPDCGKHHGGEWPMASYELKPFEDPDQQADRITEQSLEEVTEELHELVLNEPGRW